MDASLPPEYIREMTLTRMMIDWSQWRVGRHESDAPIAYDMRKELRKMHDRADAYKQFGS